MRARACLLLATFCLALCASPAVAQRPSAEEFLAPVVRIKTVINPDARTTQNLGREREGSGVVIDENGLILTIGYLMVEAHTAEVTTNDGRTVPANVVGYDHETGFGVLQAIAPLKVKPIAFGKSSALAKDEVVLIASFGGAARAAPARVAAKREFAGSWEYLLDEAIFTAPAHPSWGGAGLLGTDGKLLGVGSLLLQMTRTGVTQDINMVVPIDLLPPILDDLLAYGQVNKPPRPWLGVYSAESDGKVVVVNVAEGGPAAAAGVRRGDIVSDVRDLDVDGLADFYRKVWSSGPAGTEIPIRVVRDKRGLWLRIRSADRGSFLKKPRLQ